MSRADGPLVVLGVGNVLLRDEGIGAAVIHGIERRVERGVTALPYGTTLLDAGTLGLALLPVVADARALLLVDAADLGAAPGTVAVLGTAALRSVPSGCPGSRPSGVADLLATADLAGMLPAAVSLVGVQPASIAVGTGLSGALRAALPAVIRTTLREIRALDALAPAAIREPGAGMPCAAGALP